MNKKEVEVLVSEFIEFLRLKNINISDDKYSLPLSIFSDKLSATESVIKFLREEYKIGYKEIAKLLHKNHGSVGVTYRNAIKKNNSKQNKDFTYSIPISVFNESETLFESIVKYLHNDLKLSFKDIAKSLYRNYRTIWTIYRRSK